MQELPYLIYYLALKNNLGPKELLKLVNSNQAIKRKICYQHKKTDPEITYVFKGSERSYVTYLFNTAKLRYLFNNHQLVDTKLTEESHILDFLGRFA